ncbi:MAG: hypothetical protein ACI8UO_000449 [Verrucomicrobiales bacterium]|jgi:hypothetical protein
MKKNTEKRAKKNPRRDSRYYRFGICGGSSSGKTCILTALGMPRVPHPDDLSATLLPPPRFGDLGLRHGYRWITEQKRRLADGDVPEQNPIIDQRLALRYKITSSGGPDGVGQEHFVELIDYSGELMQAESSDAELAEKLRESLAEMDGLLIVAEYPRNRDTVDEKAKELHSLRGAFAKLREEQRERDNEQVVPMILWVNKWDRSDSAGHGMGAMSAEQDRVRAFLDGKPHPEPAAAGALPPHRTLYNELLPATNNHCELFPVSAFGPSRSDTDPTTGNTVEKPVNIEVLQSFGMEDPFIWLIQRRNALDVEELERRGKSWLLPLRPLKTRRLRKDAKRVAARISDGSEFKNRATGVSRRLRKWRALQTLTLICALLAGALLGEAAFDFNSHRKSRAALDNSAAQPAWVDAHKWYQRYIYAKPWQHFVYSGKYLSRDQAERDQLSALLKEDEKSWSEIERLEEADPNRIALAIAYVGRGEKFPDCYLCREREKAETIVLTAERHETIRNVIAELEEHRRELTVLAAKFEANQTSPELAGEIRDLSTQVNNLAEKTAELNSADLDEEKALLSQEISSLETSYNASVESDVHRRQYKDHMTSGDVVSAGVMLLTDLSDPQYDDLRSDFEQRVQERLRVRVQQLLGRGSGWQDGVAYLDEFLGKGTDDRFFDLLPTDSLANARTERTSVLWAGGQYLWNAVRANPDSLRHVTEYLDSKDQGVPMVMQEVASAHRDYLLQINSVHEYRLHVSRLIWPAETKGWWSDIEGVVTLSSGVLHSGSIELAKMHGSKSFAQSATRVPAISIKMKTKATDPLSLTVEVRNDRSKNLGGGSFGEALVRQSLDSWKRDGHVVTLKGASGGGEDGSKVTLLVQVSDGQGGWIDFAAPALEPWPASPGS